MRAVRNDAPALLLALALVSTRKKCELLPPQAPPASGCSVVFMASKFHRLDAQKWTTDTMISFASMTRSDSANFCRMRRRTRPLHSEAPTSLLLLVRVTSVRCCRHTHPPLEAAQSL
jgi:hypothetical protein